MKKKLFISTLILGATLLTGVQTQAATYDGVNTGEIQINGSIGKLDNTDPGTDLPEGSDDWINVTVDTATAFHTTVASNHANIESANYSIENNSGRGVAVYLESMTGTPTYVNSLSINPSDSAKALKDTPASVSLVANNAFTTLAQTPWLVLANHEGKLNLSNAEDFGNGVTFNYTGTTVASLPADVNENVTAENYQLTLKFQAVKEDGTY